MFSPVSWLTRFIESFTLPLSSKPITFTLTLSPSLHMSVVFSVLAFCNSEIWTNPSLVPRKFASRIKRLQVLKQAVQLGFIYEQQSEVDKRRRIYAPTEILLHDFLAYAESTNVVVEKNT